ncbi:MAG: PilZ domain-containing protein [Bryobacteraceae bacterium]
MGVLIMSLPSVLSKYIPEVKGRPALVRGVGAGVEDARKAIRFPVKLPVRYRVGQEVGWGEIVNISSNGALFTTERPLPVGKRVELFIDWPVLLSDSVRLNLVASGSIVRVESDKAAVRIRKHEFRTSSSSFQRKTAATGYGTGAGSARWPGLQAQITNHPMERVGV